MAEPRRRFQHESPAIGVRIHQQDDFFFHFSPFDRENKKTPTGPPSVCCQKRGVF
jgi:hypothetical protein